MARARSDVIVFLDMDGVIVDFVRGVKEWLGLDFDYEQVTEWNALADLSGMEDKAFWEAIDTYEFWVGLDFTPEAGDVLRLLRADENENVVLLTSPTYNGSQGKQHWIRDRLPDFFTGRRYIISPAKWAIAGPGKLLIDDSDDNVMDWEENGGDAILFPRPWNDLAGNDPVYFLDQCLSMFQTLRRR